MDADAVVLGVDLGTTATKVLAVTADGAVPHEVERKYPLRTDESGEAVQDADQVREAAVEAVADCASWVTDSGYSVAALAFTSAMHTLLGLDAADRPVTPAFNWADTRASEVARRLRADSSSAELHRATGTPVHTQSVMVKLAWLTGDAKDLTGNAVRWCALKDYVLAGFVGEVITEHSLASGSGLQDMASLRWHEPALRVAGIRADQLPELRAPTDILELTRDTASVVGLPSGTPVVLGGGDGPLANLGVGAVSDGMAALSLGTSGALRVVRDRPGVDDRCRTFSYAIAEGMWVVGGAVSNGAVVGQWAAETFGADLVTLLDEAMEADPGDLLALPYLLGERAPWWEAGLTGAIIGLRRAHGPAEITRALAEGVAQQLALVRDAVRDTGAAVRTVRATGGGFRSSVWGAVLAAALDSELAVVKGGSGLGAALLGWRALGAFASLQDAAALVETERTVSPDPATARRLAERRPSVEQLYQTLRDLHA